MALVAMALVVLMPVLSRSMASDAPMMGAMDMSMGSMDMGHAGHGHPGMPEHPDDPTAHCGYCVLLTHTPTVGSSVAIWVAPLALPTLAPSTTLPRNSFSTLLLSARPRGPPATRNG
nr:DUF2946 domain-containing protein [Dyella acidiphila]